MDSDKEFELKMEFDLKKLEFEKSLQLRNFEIDNFWKRGWFFGTLMLAMITGYITIKNSKNDDYCIYISFIALLISFAQSLMNRGSKYWQERYEFKTKSLESKLEIDVTKISRFGDNERYYLDSCILSKKQENSLTRCARFSVSKLTFLVWDIVTLTWTLIWLCEINFHCNAICCQNIRWDAVIFHAVILLYIIVFCRKGNVYEGFVQSSNKSKSSIDNKEQDSKNYLENKVS